MFIVPARNLGDNRQAGSPACHPARDETAALTEEIAKIEREIDERVAALYGL